MGFIILAGGCRRSHDARAIEFWAMGIEGEHVQKLIVDFERLHPDIKVTVQSIPWSAAHEKLLTAYAGNSMPDIFQLGNTWIPEFVALNAIEPLDTRVGNSSLIDETSYFPGIWETNFIDEVQYGLPWYVDTRVLFYRRDLLASAGYDQPPQTWEEWLAMAQKLVDEGLARYGVLLPVNEWVGPVVLGMQAGSSLLRDRDRFGNFSGPEFQAAFDFFLEFYRRGLAPRGMTEIANIYQGFAEGAIPMLITGPWNIGEFSRRLPDDLQDKWATAPLPGPTGDFPAVSLAGGSSLVIFRKSPRKAACWELAEFLSRPEVQVQFYRLTGDLPARIEAWRDPALTGNPHIPAFYQQLQKVSATPRIPEWEQIAMKVQQYAESAAYGELEPRQALEALDHDVDRILEKRRWLMKDRE